MIILGSSSRWRKMIKQSGLHGSRLLLMISSVMPSPFCLRIETDGWLFSWLVVLALRVSCNSNGIILLSWRNAQISHCRHTWRRKHSTRYVTCLKDIQLDGVIRGCYSRSVFSILLHCFNLDHGPVEALLRKFPCPPFFILLAVYRLRRLFIVIRAFYRRHCPGSGYVSLLEIRR